MKKIFLYILIIIITIYIFYILYKNYYNNNYEKFTINDVCYADIGKWVKITDTSGLDEKNIKNPTNENYILKDDSNTEILNNFDLKDTRNRARNVINIHDGIKNKFIDDIPYNIYIENTDNVKYKPTDNSWRINFINILSEYLSKIKLGTKWEIRAEKNTKYNHELDNEKLQSFIDNIKSHKPDDDTSEIIKFGIPSTTLQQYRESNLYSVDDIQTDSYFYDTDNELYYHIDLGDYDYTDINRLDILIKKNLLVGLIELNNKLNLIKIEKIKNKLLQLNLNLNNILQLDNDTFTNFLNQIIDNTTIEVLLNIILEDFTLEKIKEQLDNTELLDDSHYYNIRKRVLDSMIRELNKDTNNYKQYYNILKKILDIIIMNNDYVAKLIKNNLYSYNLLRSNMDRLNLHDRRVISLMSKIRNDLQKESGYSCNYKELSDGLINLITTFQENEDSIVYDPSFILIDNLNELDDSEHHLLYYDDSNTVSPECRSRSFSSNPYKYIKNNITSDKCYNDIINIYNKNGDTKFDNDMKHYINNKINHNEINSYHKSHLKEINSKDASNTFKQNSKKNYNCMIHFLENNTDEYNSKCHDDNENGDNDKQDTIIKDTDYIPSKYLIDTILPNYIYYLKTHVTDISDENRCLYYYDSTDESSRVTMDKLKDLPDMASLPLTDSIELTIQSKNYGKTGSENGKYGEIGTEKGKYGLIGDASDYNNYITNKQCDNIVTNIIDDINSIKDNEIQKMSSIKIDSDYITQIKQDYETKISEIDQKISDNETYFSTTKPYKDYSNIIFRKETNANKINSGNYIDITTLLRYKIDLEKINGDIEEYINNNTYCPNNKPNQCREITIDTDITIDNKKTTFDLYEFYTNTKKDGHNKQLNIVVGDYIHVQGRDIYYKITNIYNDYPVNFQNDFTDFPEEKIYSFDEWISKNIIITDLTKDYYFIVKDGQTDVYYVLNIDRNNDETLELKQDNLLYQYVNEYKKNITVTSLTDTEKCIGTEFTQSDGKSGNPCTVEGAECKEFGYRYIEDNFNNISNLNNNKDTWINNNFISDYNEIYKLSTGQNNSDLQATEANYWRNKYKSGKKCLNENEGVMMKDGDGNYRVNPDYNFGLKWYYLSENITDLPEDSIIININNMDSIFNTINTGTDTIDLRDSQEIVEFVDKNGNSIQMDVIDENYYLEIEFDNGTSRYYKVNGSNKCLSSQICSSKSNTNYRDEYNSHIDKINTDAEYCNTLNQKYGSEGISHYDSTNIQKTCYHRFPQNTDYNTLTYYPGKYDVSYTLNQE